MRTEARVMARGAVDHSSATGAVVAAVAVVAVVVVAVVAVVLAVVAVAVLAVLVVAVVAKGLFGLLRLLTVSRLLLKPSTLFILLNPSILVLKKKKNWWGHRAKRGRYENRGSPSEARSNI